MCRQHEPEVYPSAAQTLPWTTPDSAVVYLVDSLIRLYQGHVYHNSLYLFAKCLAKGRVLIFDRYLRTLSNEKMLTF